MPYEDSTAVPKKSGKVSRSPIPSGFLTPIVKSQSDYMKHWLQEKRSLYLNRILEMKADGVREKATCPVCQMGRAIWRCLDCMDKRPLCVFCCRSNHTNAIFHRIQKWNGRYYKKGALWQVGVKLYTGHNGSPCPCSLAAVSGMGTTPSRRSSTLYTSLLATLVKDFGKTEQEILTIISTAITHEVAQMTPMERDVMEAVATKSGQNLLDVIRTLSKAVQHAENEAEEMQIDSEQATAEAEGIPDTEETSFSDVIVDIPLQEEVGDDDDWEDEDDRPTKGNIPRFLPRPPPKDGMGNTFITLVHTNGFHSLPVVWCNCPGHMHDRDLQLLDLHLYPASYDNIKTVPSFACLDDYRLENLECKTSHYQYHNKIRRLTCPSHPQSAPNRYAELCRLSRQWRNLKYRKWFWLLDNFSTKRGTMGLFCAACPQPGINLEPDWKADQDRNPYDRQLSMLPWTNFVFLWNFN